MPTRSRTQRKFVTPEEIARANAETLVKCPVCQQGMIPPTIARRIEQLLRQAAEEEAEQKAR